MDNANVGTYARRILKDTEDQRVQKRSEVQSVSVLRQLVKVVVTLENDEKEIREYKVDELKFRPRKRKNDVRLSKEEMKELAALEKNEGASKLDDN